MAPSPHLWSGEEQRDRAVWRFEAYTMDFYSEGIPPWKIFGSQHPNMPFWAILA